VNSYLDSNPAEFGKMLGGILKEMLAPLKKRVDNLYENGAIDAEVIDELANTMERVDALETDRVTLTKSLGESPIALTGVDEAVARYFAAHPFGVDREYLAESHEIVERWTAAGRARELRYPAGGIHDGGYWREGMEAKPCQAFTNHGSLWIALRKTKDKPSLESQDWRLAARKGRDANR
jgi:hypothetical protein